jgi:hypothetical protein
MKEINKPTQCGKTAEFFFNIKSGGTHDNYHCY